MWFLSPDRDEREDEAQEDQRLTIEFLLLAVCLGGSTDGCSKAGTAYYESSPAMKNEAQLIEARLRHDYGDVSGTFAVANMLIKRQVIVRYTF